MKNINSFELESEGTPLRALIIDDDRALLHYHAAILEAAGLEVETEEHPDDALNAIRAFDPDLIVVDYYMPGMDGPELVAKIRQAESLPEVAILMLSAEQNTASISKAILAGAEYALAKPVDMGMFSALAISQASKARKLKNARLQLAKASKEMLFRQMALDQHAIVSTTDIHGRIISVNQRFLDISGYCIDELIGQSHRIVKSDVHPPEFYQTLWQTICEGKTWHGDVCNRSKTGELYWVQASIVPFLGPDGLPERYVSIRTDITAQKKLETEIIHAKEVAEHANRAKTEFLSSMSHELRTPMNAILGFAQLMENSRREPLSDRQKKQVQQIIRAGKHLLDLINEVLDLARIESGKLSLSMESVSVSEIAQEVMNLSQQMTSKLNVTVTNKMCGNYYVHADYMRFKQVLLNLVSNAIKYNVQDGSVTICNRVITAQNGRPPHLRIEVQDSGIGISENAQSSLFQPFQRLGHEAGEIEGTGIGLTITRKLVEAMQGSIGMESHEGQGSTFWFELPLLLSETSTEWLDSADDDMLLSSTEQDATQLKVLYVEDNPQNLMLMEDILSERDDVELLSAPDAELGIKMAQKHLPDLILMDINLPGMDGFAAQQALKMHEETAHIPVIALSANAMPNIIRQAKEAGFVDYLTKPIDLMTLESMLDTYLEKK